MYLQTFHSVVYRLLAVRPLWCESIANINDGVKRAICVWYNNELTYKSIVCI